MGVHRVHEPEGQILVQTFDLEKLLGGHSVERFGGTVARIRELGGEVFYWLARSVHPKPHPDAVPSREKLQEAAVGALQSYVDSL